ncbi:ATP-binding protein [Desulfogranum mediterraneum]|uniref:ATP-binding protein n=1 Tax=Desulfogranum mediterraneum TaxID=160661 RepID=UPI00040BFF8D|nr:ATP-binding protein [Desulfogranum mediterraneum]
MNEAEYFLERTEQSLDDFHDWLAGLGQSWGLSRTMVLEINLIIEELYTNCIKYGGGPDSGPVRVALARSSTEVQILIEDRGPPFDPLKVQPPDLIQPMEERQAGGLGLHLVRHFADSCGYARRSGKNILRLTKVIGCG